jgi:acetyltransferase
MTTRIPTCRAVRERFRDGRAFIEAARNCKKPIVVLKSGVSAHGAAAAASHTGSLAGAAKIYSTAFRQAGVTQATDLNDLFDRTLALSLQPRMKGDNLLILTNGGGVRARHGLRENTVYRCTLPPRMFRKK